jgi:hypothetical protein
LAASSFPSSASRPSTSSLPPCIWFETNRHCERSEAIQTATKKESIASSLSSSQ